MKWKIPACIAGAGGNGCGVWGFFWEAGDTVKYYVGRSFFGRPADRTPTGFWRKFCPRCPFCCPKRFVCFRRNPNRSDYIENVKNAEKSLETKILEAFFVASCADLDISGFLRKHSCCPIRQIFIVEICNLQSALCIQKYLLIIGPSLWIAEVSAPCVFWKSE